ncbi:MAG: peptidoglycan DD-metalloendopeptidase family protein [Bacteroidales bacterium]|nr:peptidoglycan DD-metalloendopeptidase family protein [Bacteroidales bacterium]
MTGIFIRMVYRYAFIITVLLPFISVAQYPVVQKGNSRIFSAGVCKAVTPWVNEKPNSFQNLRLPALAYPNIGKLQEVSGALFKEKAPPEFILPVKLIDGINDPGFFSITAYVDHDTLFPGHLLDYSCGDLTYDLDEGYNHTGTDFFLWPFPWKKMDDQEVEVVAAAPGIIIYKQDGNFDRHCEPNSDPWNALAIRHSEGYTTWYGHLKANSLTGKETGNYVDEGEYLGIVGSSGSSLSPHLHFEVYDSLYNLIDPFAGPCNPDIGGSMWKEQMPYKEPYVNKISTNHKVPVFPGCPETESPNESDLFRMGDTIFLLSYFSNMQTGDDVSVRIKRPDQTLWAEWNWNSPWEFYTSTYLYFFIILKEEKEGNWTYELTYKNKSYLHDFHVSESQGLENTFRNDEPEIFPNPVKDRLIVKFPFTDENRELNIMDAMGISVLKTTVEKGEKKVQLDVSALGRGVYVIRIQEKELQFSEKLILY